MSDLNASEPLKTFSAYKKVFCCSFHKSPPTTKDNVMSSNFVSGA